MNVRPLRGASLVAATVCIGLMAGAFLVYAIAVMPGLGRTGDRTFVDAFQSIDREIVNYGIGGITPVLMGGLVFTILAGALHLGSAERSVLPWIVAALVLFVAALVITGSVNVPRNDEIKAAGDPDSIDLAAVRERFDEEVWVRWNWVRTATTTAAVGCMSWALVLFGRLRQSATP